MAFQMDLDGHNLIVDASEESEGMIWGPVQKLLAGLIGCTGIDVVSILNKMKIKPDDMRLEARAESSDEHPKVYTKIHLIYRFRGRICPWISWNGQFLCLRKDTAEYPLC